MDLGTIRSRLNKQHFNHYQSVEEFVGDVQLVFTNCDTFNPVRYNINLSKTVYLLCFCRDLHFYLWS